MDSGRVLLSCPSYDCRHTPDAQVVPPLRIMGHILSNEHQRIASHSQPFNLLVNGLHRQQTTFDSTSSCEKTDLRISHKKGVASDLHSVPFVCTVRTDEPEDAQLSYVRLSDLQMQCSFKELETVTPIHCAPVLVLDRISAEEFKKYYRKYNDNQLAQKMAKTGERCSQRKRAADAEALVSTADSSFRPISKRMRISSNRTLVPLEPEVIHKYKRRVFLDRPVGPMVPNCMRPEERPAFCEQLAPTDFDTEPQFESLSAPLTSNLCLEIDDLFLLSEGLIPAVATIARSEIPVAKPILRSSSPESDSDICDPSESSEQLSPRSPVQMDDPLKFLKTWSPVSSAKQSHVSGPVAADKVTGEVVVTDSAKQRYECEESTDQVVSSDVSNSSVSKTNVSNAVAPNSSEPLPATVAQPVQRKPGVSSGTTERRKRCSFCFMSLLFMSPDQLKQHTSVAHPDLDF